jgi:hypothetical protein
MGFRECDGHHIRLWQHFLFKRKSLHNSDLRALPPCSRKLPRRPKRLFRLETLIMPAHLQQNNDSLELSTNNLRSPIWIRRVGTKQTLSDRAESKPMTGKVFRAQLTATELQVLRRHPLGRSAVFWTVFTLAVLVWMVGLAISFGPGVMPLLLVLGTILVAMNLAFRRTSSN